MNLCECSQCGVTEAGLVWGFTLLTRKGWGVAPATNPPGAAERSWLCAECNTRAESVARGLGRLSAPRPARERTRKSRPLRVLVVDDHILMLKSMVRMLAGNDTVVATNSLQAWDMLQSGAQFDAIVSDVMMPDLTGPDLFARCFVRSPELAQRFVFASGDPLAARRMIDEAVASVGATQAPTLLQKPTSREAVLCAVALVAAGAPHQSGTYELRLPQGLTAEIRDGAAEASDADQTRGSRSSRY